MDNEPQCDEPPATVGINPPEAARAAIWQLFEQGQLDEDAATASLLAVDVGMRRSGAADPTGIPLLGSMR